MGGSTGYLRPPILYKKAQVAYLILPQYLTNRKNDYIIDKQHKKKT